MIPLVILSIPIKASSNRRIEGRDAIARAKAWNEVSSDGVSVHSEVHTSRCLSPPLILDPPLPTVSPGV